MNTVTVPLVGAIEGNDGEDPRVVFSPPKKRKSRKDLKIERLTMDLEQAKRSLNTIFETLANEAMPYPERVGYCKGNAAWALYVIGGARPEIAKEVASEVASIYITRDEGGYYSQTMPDGTISYGFSDGVWE